MRVTTNQIFDRPTSLMSSLSAHADRLQTQIATGKKFTSPSDDAAAFLRLEGLKRSDADSAAWSANVKLAQGMLAQSDGALESVETQLQRAKELALQAANGTMSPTDRKAAGEALNAVIDELFAVANTRDARGQPLFGGADTATPYVRDGAGAISYATAGEPGAIPIGNGDSVHATVTGERAFGDMFVTLQALATALSAGEPVPDDSLGGIQTALDQTVVARASVGARAFRLDLEAERITAQDIEREQRREAIESTDVTAAITELQKTLTVLQATQASFTKLSSMSLFDYLR